jgi:polyribonucleotide nucleotidyltransferase
VGQKVQVEIAEIDSRGKLSLVPVIEGEEGSDEAKDDAEQ